MECERKLRKRGGQLLPHTIYMPARTVRSERVRYSDMNNDNRELVSTYLSRQVFNECTVPELTTLDGRQFHIFMTRLK